MAIHTRKIDAAELARTCACFNLRKAARAATQLYDAALGPSGLRATQVSVLVALALHERVPLGRLAETLIMDRTTLTRNLRPLEKQGWVAGERGPDRRERYIVLTRAGRAVLERALPLWHEVQSRVAAALGAGRLAGLVGELDAVVRAVRGAEAAKRG
jgi:DNA-binding MarR family transcriptional regulator